MRILRSLVALLVLLGLVVGAPILLWRMGSGLLPHEIPTLTEIWDTLTSRDTGQVFMGALVVIGFLAWAVFTVCVLTEIGARLTGRRSAPQIRWLRVPQSAATGLIGAILAGSVVLGAAGPAVAATAGPDLHQALTAITAVTPTRTTTAAATSAAAEPTPISQEASAGASSWNGPVWVVSRYDTFWGIAEHTLGDGLRYQEIVDLNVGVPQADGGTIHDADTYLEIGWHLRLPAGAATSQPTQVTVHPGDTLSQIAADHLGSADQYTELAALNDIRDPDLIEVGDIIKLTAQEPAPAAEAPTADPAPAEPTPAASPDPAGDVGQNQPAAAAPPAVDDPPTASSTSAEPSSPAAPPSIGQIQAPAAATPTAPAADSDQPAAGSSALAAGLGLSGILAAAAWIGLRIARRRKGRYRPPGEFPAPTSLQAARTERSIRQHASTRDVLWMDRALRHAAQLAAERDPADLPDVTCAWLSAQELQLQLAAPVPVPAPFTADGDSWILPFGTELPPDPVDTAAPFPLLTSLGELDGETLLVDLERLGAVSITGDRDRTRDLLVHLAVELATNTWSDHLQVTLVGWGAELVTLNPDRLSHLPDVADVTTLVQGRVNDTRQTLNDLHTTVVADRLVDDGAGDWAPEVWLIDTTDRDDLAALENILATVGATGRTTVAVVARSDRLTPAGAAVIHIDEQGTLTLSAVLGDLRVQAAAAGPDTLERLLELFESAGRFSPPGPMPGPEPWARGMTTDGALIPEELLTAPAPEPVIADQDGENDAGDGEPDQVGQEPPPAPTDTLAKGQEPDVAAADGGPVEQDGGQVLPLRPTPSPAAVAVLRSTLAADEDLDEDLAEWFAATPRRPQVAVLGPPNVTASGPPPSGRLARMTEMAVYLGTHREVDADKFVTDLWAEDATVKAVSRRSDVSRVRAWLGVDEQGRKYLPEARSKPYRLTRLLDLDLFRRLRKRADARAGAGDPVGAQRDLLTALMLVRGSVMDQASPDAYGWLLTSDPAGVQQAALMVIATAHQLVDSALADGDLDLARVAADIAHRVDPGEDQPLCDLLRISHRAGDDLAARSWAQLLLQSNGVETPEDLPNFDSFQAVNEVFPRGLRAAAAAITG